MPEAVHLETQLALWLEEGVVVDKRTGFLRRPTETEVLVMKDEETRQELRAAQKKKKEKARARKRLRLRGSQQNPEHASHEEEESDDVNTRRTWQEEIAHVGHRFYQMVTARDFYWGHGQRDQSWKRHRQTRWRERSARVSSLQQW